MRIIPVVISVLLLAGCASPMAEPTPEPEPTQTPTPTPTVAAEPSATFPVACSDLATDAEATALAGYPVELAPRAWQLESIHRVALVQGGLLTCEWTTPGERPARSADVTISVSTDGPIVDPALGIACQVGSCQVDVGGNWLRVYAFDSDDGSAPDPVAWDAFLEATKTTVSATTEVEPRWTPPTDVALFDGCPSGFEPAPSGFATTADLAGLRWCSGGDRYFGALPGGAWAMPTLLTDLPEEYHKSAWAPVEVAGSQGAIIRSGDGSFDLLASVDGSLVQISRGIDVMEGGPQAPEITAGLVAELETIIAAR